MLHWKAQARARTEPRIMLCSAMLQLLPMGERMLQPCGFRQPYGCVQRSHTWEAPSFRGMPLMMRCRGLGPRPRRVVCVESNCSEFCSAQPVQDEATGLLALDGNKRSICFVRMLPTEKGIPCPEIY
jgi:hypothetical protein